MENAQGGFNNILNSKLSLYQDDIIRLSHFRHIHRLQYSLGNRYASTVLGQFKSLFEYIKPTKVDKKFIRKFRHGHSRIKFARWGRRGFNDYAVIVYDPDVEIQNLISQIMQVCPMSLSQVEVAFDFYPENEYDLRELRRVLTDGLIFKHSRARCYFNFSKLEFRGTEYIGKKGVVRKGSKGLRIYNKQQDGRHFLRMELQFNRPFIKSNGISLPVNADRFNLFDFVDYRKALDEDRLLKVLCKKWARPVKRAADVEMLRSLALCGIYSWVLNVIVCPSDIVCEQMSLFKVNLKHENLIHRINEFFPKSRKKEMILEDVQDGFVRRECLRTMERSLPSGVCCPAAQG